MNLTHPSATPNLIPYAFVRFCNEEITLKACLESLPSFVDRGVICYHELPPGVDADGSVAIAQEFVAKHRGFKLVKYPLPVIPQNNKFLANSIGTRNDICRYWLLDAFYNYALSALIQLAIDNGEYDRAWLFKVDADHVYNPDACLKAIRFMHQIKYVKHSFPHINVLTFAKFNVARNYYNLARAQEIYIENQAQQRQVSSEVRAQLIANARNKPLLLNQLPAHLDHEHLYLNSLNVDDHMLVKLDCVAPFLFIMTQERLPSAESSELQDIEKFRNWEKFTVKDNGMTFKEQLFQANFLSSFHFCLEKFFWAQPCSLNNALQLLDNYSDKQYYDQIESKLNQLDESCFFKMSDDPFWSEANLRKIVASFNYPKFEDVLNSQKNYGREFDVEELLRNPRYRVETVVNDINQRWQQATGELEAQVAFEFKVFKRLIQEMTKPIKIYNFENELLKTLE